MPYFYDVVVVEMKPISISDRPERVRAGPRLWLGLSCGKNMKSRTRLPFPDSVLE